MFLSRLHFKIADNERVLPNDRSEQRAGKIAGLREACEILESIATQAAANDDHEETMNA